MGEVISRDKAAYTARGRDNLAAPRLSGALVRRPRPAQRPGVGCSLDEAGSGSSATSARNSLLGLNTGTGRAATSTGSPVRGFRAMRVLRRRILKVPKPRTSMLCWSLSASLTASRNASTTRAQSFLEIIGPAVLAIEPASPSARADVIGPAVLAIEAVRCSTRSVLVRLPPDGLLAAERAGLLTPIL